MQNESHWAKIKVYVKIKGCVLAGEFKFISLPFTTCRGHEPFVASGLISPFSKPACHVATSHTAFSPVLSFTSLFCA